MDRNDASCRQMAGLWPNGDPIFGGGSGVIIDSGGGYGGLGSGLLSGDFGPLGFPSGGGWGLPCDWGTCGGASPNAYVTDVMVSEGQFKMVADVWWPFLPEPGQNPLYDAGVLASLVASPWAPVAWYGTSAAVSVLGPVSYPSYLAILHFSANNPITWRCATSFAFNLLSPPSPLGVDTDEYPCGRAGQMASAIVSSVVPHH
jgi:hypothetical protein